MPTPRSLSSCSARGRSSLVGADKIDVANQSFHATIWLPFVVEGGALDPALSADGAVFPIGPDGTPTFTPSARWYADQIDFRNALTFRVVNCAVQKRGNDLVIAVRFAGEFSEVFELENYPFDVQGLTITLNINCRYHGPMPVVLDVADSATVTMTCVRLCPPNRQWRVAPELNVRSQCVHAGLNTCT